MAIHRFELLFEPPRKKPLPDSARAHVALSFYGRENDRILVSPECRTERELEGAINNLKKDLDRVLTQARRKFAQHAHTRSNRE